MLCSVTLGDQSQVKFSILFSLEYLYFWNEQYAASDSGVY